MIKNLADGLLHNVAEPMTELPIQWFQRKCTTKLSKSLLGGVLPINFTKKLFKKVKKLVKKFVELDHDLDNEQGFHIINVDLETEFSRIDEDSTNHATTLLNLHDRIYLKRLIQKTTLKIRTNSFQPKLISAIPGSYSTTSFLYSKAYFYR
jgi:hypothetical protein